MKLLETKEVLTLKELLQIAYEYGNDNAYIPEDEPQVGIGFNKWIQESDDLMKKLVITCDYKII